jgi:hypothetical protein
MTDARRRGDGYQRALRSRRRRAGRVAAVAGILVAACAGCSASPKVSPAKSELTLLLEFSACMRAHGLPDFPDPQSGSAGGYATGSLPPVTPQYNAAEKACQSLAIASGYEQTPAEIQKHVEQETAESECMRKHGVPEMPNPDAQGAIVITPSPGSPGRPAWWGSPQFQAAQKRCAYLNPEGG